jgi:hypothetical protein
MILLSSLNVALAERLVTNWYAYDERIHGQLKLRAEAELQGHPAIEQMKQLSGKYNEIELLRGDSGRGKENRGSGRSVKLDSRDWEKLMRKLAVMFGRSPVAAGVSPDIAPSPVLHQRLLRQ